MKHKQTTIQRQLLRALAASVGLAGACMLVLCFLMLLGSLYMPFAIFFNRHVFIFILAFLVIFSLLTIAFFRLFIQKRIRYLEAITKTLQEMSENNLDARIPVSGGDELEKMAATVNDMAFRLKTSLEEERSLEKSKNDLITNISHDIRTPLTSALGYLDLISRLETGEEENLRRYSSIALDQCRELKVLIDELFEYSKVSNPGLVVNKTRIRMGEFLEQVILGFIPAFESAGMEYRLNFSDGKMMVEADPMLMKRVFDNLIGNAVRYGKGGRYVDIGLFRENNEAVIRVTSYGRTIPEADLSHVFERYYQVKGADPGEKTGSGLGLAIVKNIVTLHGGAVRAFHSGDATIFETRLHISE